MPIMLSNRHQALLESMQNFGNSIEGIRKAQKEAARQAEQDKMAAETHAASMRQAANQDQLQGFALRSAKQAETDAADQRAAGLEARGLSDQLAGFGQAVSDSAIGLPGMQMQQSPRPVMDDSSEGVKDRLRAAWMTADARSRGENTAFSAADVRKKRAADAQAQADSQAKSAADLESTRAGTALKLMDAKKADMEIKKTQAEIDRMAAGGMDPDKAAGIEGTLRSQFLGLTKPFQEVRDSYNRLRNIKDSPAGDVGLIFAFMKINDPGASVQEGDKANVANTAGVPERIRTMYNNALTGASLDPKVRADLRAQAESMFNSQKSIYDSTRESFRNLATRYQVDPEKATIDLSGGITTKPPAASGPRSFKTAREAMAAGLPAGTRVMINGEEAEM